MPQWWPSAFALVIMLMVNLVQWVASHTVPTLIESMVIYLLAAVYMETNSVRDDLRRERKERDREKTTILHAGGRR